MPRCQRPAGAGTDARSSKSGSEPRQVDAVILVNLGDRTGRHAVPETHELGYQRIQGELRPSGSRMLRVDPLSGDEAPVPAKENLGWDAESRPTPPWHQPTQRGEPCAIGGHVARWRILATQDLDSVPEHQGSRLL